VATGGNASVGRGAGAARPEASGETSGSEFTVKRERSFLFKSKFVTEPEFPVRSLPGGLEPVPVFEPSGKVSGAGSAERGGEGGGGGAGLAKSVERSFR
jgi:hypothetical protein